MERSPFTPETLKATQAVMDTLMSLNAVESDNWAWQHGDNPFNLVHRALVRMASDVYRDAELGREFVELFYEINESAAYVDSQLRLRHCEHGDGYVDWHYARNTDGAYVKDEHGEPVRVYDDFYTCEDCGAAFGHFADCTTCKDGLVPVPTTHVFHNGWIACPDCEGMGTVTL